jgi:V/A-type H+-transporting ATPase subunit B
MNIMIQLYAQARETEEKQAMGFELSDWDQRLLDYGQKFEQQMMDLKVNISLEQALNLGWDILASCFAPQETGIASNLVDEFWPK